MVKGAPRNRAIRDSAEDKVLYAVVNAIMAFLLIIVAYPLIYVLSGSFSSGTAIQAGRVFLWPVDLTLAGYQAVIGHRLIVSGYINTFAYTAVGTTINVVVTMICAYPLSRRDMQWKSFYMVLFVITMYFSGGLIPTYMLIRGLGLYNTFWVMVIPGAMSVYNMIVTRTFFMNTIPQDLLEASQIDGCSDARYFFSIVLPLSKAIVAVMALFYAVGHWNSYFSALIYLDDQWRLPLQIVLRNILVANQQIVPSEFSDPEVIAANANLASQLKFSLIVVSTVPILCFYPFVQRYFVKGVMIGSIKG